MLIKKIRLLLLGLIGFLGIALWHYSSMLASPGPLMQSKTLIIPKGSGLRTIGKTLAEEDVIHSEWLFEAAAVLQDQHTRFKAGEYDFPAGITMTGIIDMLSAGKTVIRRITIAEGLQVREVRTLLEKEPALTEKLPAEIPEGSLLPETYHFSYGDSRADLIARMQRSLRDTLANAWETRKPGLPFRNPREALILASIVEKETRIASERPRVAAVYINRLKVGMKLQADPTTRYAVEQTEGPMTRALTLHDLRKEHPYNTYAVAGLPPGPIANPGKSSIEATLNPDASDELYFVATGTGGHRFSKTLQEHQANVSLYRKQQKEMQANP